MYVEGNNFAQKRIYVNAKKTKQREETHKGRKINLVFCIYCSAFTKERKAY